MLQYRNRFSGIILTPPNEHCAQLLANDPVYEEIRPAAKKPAAAKKPKGGGAGENHGG